MIQEDYVSFEIAKLLKEKGFDEATNRYYNAQYDEIRTVSDTFMTYWNNEGHMKVLMMEGALAIPTLQMACKWLREEFDLNIEIDTIGRKDKGTLIWRSIIYNLNNELECYYNENCSSYEEAVEVALKYVLENLI